MKVTSPESKTPEALRTVLAALLLAATLPLAVSAALVLYIRARYRGVRLRSAAPAPLERTPGVKTMSELMGLLKEVPFRTRVPTRLATAGYLLLDAVPAALNSMRATAGLVYPYPDVFEPVVVESQDGTPVCGLLAMQPHVDARPALVVVHGLFGSKNSYGMQQLALKAYYEWGFHVCALDLRNFGDSSRFSEAPTSWGYRESDDVSAAAEYLESMPHVSTVGVCGVSMGAASALLAAGRSKLDRPLSGGVVALNGYADAERELEFVCSTPGLSPDAAGVWLLFRVLLAAKTLLGGPRLFTDLRAYNREVTAQYYELAERDIFARASAVKAVGEVEVPCLIIHAIDDRVVPVDEAYDLLAAAMDNPMVDSLIVPTGGHGLYQMTSPGWFYRVLETFFTYWAEFGPPPGQRAGQSGSESSGTHGNPNN